MVNFTMENHIVQKESSKKIYFENLIGFRVLE